MNPGKTRCLQNENTERRRSKRMKRFPDVFLSCQLQILRTRCLPHAFHSVTRAELVFLPREGSCLGVQRQENKQKQPFLEETHSNEKSPKNHLRSNQTGYPKVDILFFFLMEKNRSVWGGKKRANREYKTTFITATKKKANSRMVCPRGYFQMESISIL